MREEKRDGGREGKGEEYVRGNSERKKDGHDLCGETFRNKLIFSPFSVLMAVTIINIKKGHILY